MTRIHRTILLCLATTPAGAGAANAVEPAGSFTREVTAVLSRAGCNMGACHGNINGKGGFRLSLRGEDPAGDHRSITRDSQGRRVNPIDPWSSLLLAKPTGRVPHEGGVRFTADSLEARILAKWIANGLLDDRATQPPVVALRVEPAERLVPAAEREQPLRIEAEFADGSRADVTRLTAFDVSDPTKANVLPSGAVVAARGVETAVSVRYLEGRAVSRLVFLPDRPEFRWSAPPARGAIDRHVFAKLEAVRILPSEPATDAVFLRRAYLDAIGILPTADETRAFLADDRPDKRDRLIESLLDRPEFADFWALKWADLLRNEEKTMGDKGVWVFQRWLRDRIASDTPLDEFARSIVAARGSTWANPPASFYRTNRDPESAAEAVAQVFLGVRLQCARCHNHPFDNWTQDDYYGLAAHFVGLNRKLCDPSRRDRFDNHEINGDVIVHHSGQAEIVQPRSGAKLAARPPGRGTKPLALGGDPLDSLADWLTRENRQFARNMANRVWYHLMGRGVVEPVDDFRDSNPPSIPALLDELTDQFIAGGYRLRPLVRAIMTSSVYGLGSETNSTNLDDDSDFSHASVRLLPAEVLLDALGQALGRPRRSPNAPESTRIAQLPGVASTDPFLSVFGKPARLLTCECERSSETSLAQAFQLINGESVRRMLEADDNRIGALLSSGRSDAAILEELTLAILTRYPTATEAERLLAHIARGGDRRKSWEDVAWALINSKAFLLRR
ncbi:MAG: DUF1549 and DUF1553 domain-containing protein [Isosphaeraceae bacterium]|nr:DUF1549 and DUF1553 domain-containing protein [Isosphaeraceae bacterium]